MLFHQLKSFIIVQMTAIEEKNRKLGEVGKRETMTMPNNLENKCKPFSFNNCLEFELKVSLSIQ